nr:MAG TPA: Putative vitamin uptake transporter [Caudoviricetes sp.]
MKKTNSKLETALTVLFVTCFLISNILAGKQFQLPFNITMTGAVIVFPITYILSDLFSEVYGYEWSRKTCYMAFAMNMLMVVFFEIAIHTPSPSYWTNQEAFQTVLGSTPRVLLASMLAFLFGDWANDKVFAKMKEKHLNEMKGFGARAILSSLIGEMCDSLIFIPIAFMGTMPFETLVIMGITQVSLKTLYEIIILPLTTYFTRKASIYESKQ